MSGMFCGFLAVTLLLTVPGLIGGVVSSIVFGLHQGWYLFIF